ncbi:TetR/AcrR family transcriptional regulator [Ralstonia sp. 25C]|uniref:TetR/AcrR family transcriptional regulator n=1 Tax=Ralstonia sp. 25C TaxID=3447363 RepID=UPI003F753295
MTAAAKPDHRSRVAAERRERMHARLVESALAVFAEKGVGASVIQDVIAAAGVSQGTFYNYFRTNEELLVAVAEELSNELISLIEAEVKKYADPAERIATGVRLYLYKARAFPLFARFIVQTGIHLATPNNLIYEYLPQHLEEGFATGRFRRIPIEIALDLISGLALATIARLMANEAAEDHPERVVATLLNALGVPEKDVSRIAFAPIQPLAVAEDSLVARATARAFAQAEPA